MKFDDNLRAYFGADHGAFSIVTEREAEGDKSITLDKDEKEVLHSKIPAEEFTRGGGAKNDGKPMNWELQVFDSNTIEYSSKEVAIKYPKRSGAELRLYFRRETGFYPSAGEVGFIFTKPEDDRVFIGHLPKNDWDNIASGDSRRTAYQRDYSLDEHDSEYQKSINDPSPRSEDTRTSGVKAARDPKKGADAIKKAAYKCEIDEHHETFISEFSGKPYVEAHHLVPMSARENFYNSLDKPGNIVSLCAHCHRAIHYAEIGTRRELISELFKKREDALAEAGIHLPLDELFKYYNV